MSLFETKRDGPRGGHPLRRTLVFTFLCLFIVTVVILTALLFRAPPAQPLKENLLRDEEDGIHVVCLNLLLFANDHPALTARDFAGKGIADLVAMGAFSQKEATFLRDHAVVFHGFDPEHRDGTHPIFEAEYPPAAPQVRILAFADGRIAVSDLNKKPFKPKLPQE